jgi:hypothetical protein
VIDISSDPPDEAALAAAAFGANPGGWPLPTAGTPHQRWLRAVAAAGQGRYSHARSDLAALLRIAPAGVPASLAHSAHASFLRQLGWHDLARGRDGRALLLASGDAEAAGDALTGLAADALGVGRLAAAATLLGRADSVMAQAPHRLAVRRSWVAAELAMAGGDGVTAVRHAEAAVELATATESARHHTKSQVVLAAALCSAGDVDRARTVGEGALELTGELGLLPLRWAVASLLVDLVDTGGPTAELRDLRDECASRVRRWGGAWRQL